MSQSIKILIVGQWILTTLTRTSSSWPLLVYLNCLQLSMFSMLTWLKCKLSTIIKMKYESNLLTKWRFVTKFLYLWINTQNSVLNTDGQDELVLQNDSKLNHNTRMEPHKIGGVFGQTNRNGVSIYTPFFACYFTGAVYSNTVI
jgi:hypothetical protein